MGPPVSRQDCLFYDFGLDDVVPADILLRKINVVLNRCCLRDGLKAHYSDTGRPWVRSELVIRMLMLGN